MTTNGVIRSGVLAAIGASGVSERTNFEAIMEWCYRV